MTTTEAELAVRQIKEIQDFFAAMASGEAARKFGHIKYYDAHKPVLLVANDRKRT